MLYRIVKIWVRLTLTLFCRNIRWNDLARTRAKGPLILACNHPNSFLDAIIVGSRFKEPVHFLARGDAFRRPFARRLLSALKLIPIYRLSEGREYLALNDTTFQQCQEVLAQGGILLIFSEGLCEHQWGLRPLKKGTARIAFNAWDSIASLGCEVWPVSISYNSFHRFGKRVIVQFGQPLIAPEMDLLLNEGERFNQFNLRLSDRLKKGLAPSISYGQSTLNHTPELILPVLGGILLAIPAIAGWLLHFPYYRIVRNFTAKKTDGTVFYDSVLFGLLLFTYPLYWILLTLSGWAGASLAAGRYRMPITLILLFMPVWAYVYLVWKDCINEVIHYRRVMIR